MIDESIIEAIYKLGNNETIKNKCHPNVVRNLPLEEWMIERTLYCINLLQEEWDDFQRKPQSDNNKPKQRRSKSVHKVPKE
jgi:hypothetical protein